MAESPTSASQKPESFLNTMDPSPEYQRRLEQQAVRKLDLTLLPVVTMFNFVSILDRSNIGNARVAGLQKDLHMTDKQYELCILVLFVPYIVSELPSNLLLRKIGPRLLLPPLLTLWGIIALLQGFATSYGGLIALRVILGLLEGPLGPGIVLCLSSFYTRQELSFRTSLFLSAIPLSGAFSGLLAAAIEKMDGLSGRPGWAWIFILEGLFTVLVGLSGFLFFPSTPRDSKFLTEDQKDIIMKRLERDRPFVRPLDPFSFKEVLRCIASPHVIITFFIAFIFGTLVYGLLLFLPSIVSQLGFSSIKTQLLSVGPFMLGFLVTLFSAYVSDHYQSRGIVMSLTSIISIIGFALYLGAKNKSTSYGSLYLTVPGVAGIGPPLCAWMANNSEPHYRRATSVALIFIAANLGGILSTLSYPTKEGPKFRLTTTRNLVFSFLVILFSLVNVAYLSWRNKLKKRPEVRAKLLEKYASAEKGDDGEMSAFVDLGDQHPDFVYTL